MITQPVQRPRRILGLFIALIFFCLFAITGCSAVENNRIPNKVLLPNGYIGWVRVDYGVKGAPSLPKVGGYYVQHIPTSGYLKTSTLIEDGWAKDEYYYIQGQSSKLLDEANQIWDDGTSPTQEQSGSAAPKATNAITLSYFVGSQAARDFLTKLPISVGAVSPIASRAWKKGRDLSSRTLKSHSFVGMNLYGANLSDADFTKGNFQGVNLSYAFGSTSDFINSNFQKANLYAADIHDADLTGADLRHANLQKTRLQGANLSGVKLQGADLRGAEYDAKTKWPYGFRPRTHGAMPVVRMDSDT